MRTDLDKKFRKISRDFKGKVELTNKTPIEYLEKMFVEMYDFNLQYYIDTERKLHPKKSRKEILIEMYKLKERLKGRKYK